MRMRLFAGQRRQKNRTRSLRGRSVNRSAGVEGATPRHVKDCWPKVRPCAVSMVGRSWRPPFVLEVGDFAHRSGNEHILTYRRCAFFIEERLAGNHFDSDTKAEWNVLKEHKR